MTDDIVLHCRELDLCNQRGGRMLSVLDLIDAGTLDLDLAAFLMNRIVRGASLMVGARPGGAGKTTVMCALLNLAAPGVRLLAATPEVVHAATGAATPGHGIPRRCYICHEIGAGHYFAYLWGRDLRAYCALAEQGHLLATNLHADDIDETRNQVCRQNAVPEGQFNAFHLLVYLRVSGGYRASRHWIEKVYASDGRQPHALVYDSQRGLRPEVLEVDAGHIGRCRAFLAGLVETDVRTIADVRGRVLAFCQEERRSREDGADGSCARR